jgi:gliding motility-associated GldM-like protein
MKSFNQIKRTPHSWGYFFIFAGLIGLFAFNGFESKDPKTVSVAADKMNVFYIGVDNPITVAVEEVSDESVGVASDDVEITKTARGQYNVKALKPGTATILVYGDGFESQQLTFRVKRLPDPIAVLDNSKSLNWFEGGKLKPEEFKDSKGMTLTMGNFDFETNIEIAEFSMVWVSKRDDPTEVVNRQASFNDRAKALLDKAASGDTYYFENVVARVPGTTGDENLLKLNSLVFRIE